MPSKRCNAPECKKKVVLDVLCKCAKVFCPEHRMPEDHGCSFDFKTEGQKTLSAELVKVVAEKILII
jgi:hypothetical protein